MSMPTETTPNMGLILPVPIMTAGPGYAYLLDAAQYVIDSHDHSSGKGVQVTPAGLNISSDLTFNQNNATNLRTARLFNNTSITIGINDKTCLYALSNELYYVDGAGNNVQITLNGALDLSSSISLINIKDTNFTLEYFGDTSRKAQFSVANVPASTENIYAFPAITSGTTDTLVAAASTQTLTNKVLSGNTAVTLISGSGTLTLPTSGTVTVPNGTDTLVSLTGTQTLTNKTLGATTVQSAAALSFNNSGNTFHTSLAAGANTGNYAAILPIADGTNGQSLTTNGSGQWGWTTIGAPVANVAANDSNVTFTYANNHYQVCTPTAARTYTMPTTSVPQGDIWTFDNQSTFAITINASGGATICTCYPGTMTTLIALVATPTTAANWVQLFSSAQQILGSTLGVAPVAGVLGQEIVSTVTTGTNFPSSGSQGNATSISLTAGIWDISFAVVTAINSSTPSGGFAMAISASSGSFTGTSLGNNQVGMPQPALTTNVTTTIPAYRVTISSSATYYGVVVGTYSAGTPQFYCRLKAVRVG